MGWIEAKKSCELNGAHLLTLESIEESEVVLEHLISQTRRRSRFEYWTAGNDIEKEDIWEWSGTREAVPDIECSKSNYKRHRPSSIDSFHQCRTSS